MSRAMDLLIGISTLACCCGALGAETVGLSSPGLPPSQFHANGVLAEDWGTLTVTLTGDGLAPGEQRLEAVALENVVPAARWSADFGQIRLQVTAYKAPVYPQGMDVLEVQLEETGGEPRSVTLNLQPSAQLGVGLSTARLGNRVVLSIPVETQRFLETRDWGYVIDTTPMPGWAKPEGDCDPGFANIRAGMGGIPIRYRFRVEKGGKVQVVLGLCESFYGQAGIRPLLCEVEGARPLLVDPVARWGQHKPGALLFTASDDDADGWVTITIRPVPGARDRNPILNVVWVFPTNVRLNLNKVISGALNDQARYYVDVGGKKDQPLLLTEGLRFPLELAAGEKRTLTFYVACAGGQAVVPELTAWTPESLFRAAREVWTGWAQR